MRPGYDYLLMCKDILKVLDRSIKNALHMKQNRVDYTLFMLLDPVSGLLTYLKEFYPEKKAKYCTDDAL